MTEGVTTRFGGSASFCHHAKSPPDTSAATDEVKQEEYPEEGVILHNYQRIGLETVTFNTNAPAGPKWEDAPDQIRA